MTSLLRLRFVLPAATRSTDTVQVIVSVPASSVMSATNVVPKQSVTGHRSAVPSSFSVTVVRRAGNFTANDCLLAFPVVPMGHVPMVLSAALPGRYAELLSHENAPIGRVPSAAKVSWFPPLSLLFSAAFVTALIGTSPPTDVATTTCSLKDAPLDRVPMAQSILPADASAAT